MGIPFFQGPLGLVGRLFNFMEGDQGISAVEGRLPIIRVLDVTRIAELGNDYTVEGGYFLKQVYQTHAGADTERNNLTIHSLVDTWRGNRNQIYFDLWLVSASLSMPTGTLASGSMGFIYDLEYPGALGTANSEAIVLLQEYDGGEVPVNNLAAAGDRFMATQTPELPATFPAPLLAPRGGRVALQTISTGAGTHRWDLLFWLGPRGARARGIG